MSDALLPSYTAYYYANGQRIAMAVNGSFSYVVSDGLGSANAVLSGSGSATASVLYAPYGSARYSSGTMPTDRGFTGQIADSTSGLDYYGARYYDAVAAQFSSADTVLPGGGFDIWGLSRYAYVEGNPIIHTDPTGRMLVCDCAGSSPSAMALVTTRPIATRSFWTPPVTAAPSQRTSAPAATCATFICSGGVGVNGDVGGGLGIVGAQVSGQATVGFFGGGRQGPHFGGDATGAAFASAGGYYATYPSTTGLDDRNYGAVESGGVALWVSDAKSARQLRGGFHNLTVAFGASTGVSLNIQYDDHGTWIASLGAPAVSQTYGALVSKFESNTGGWIDFGQGPGGWQW